MSLARLEIKCDLIRNIGTRFMFVCFFSFQDIVLEQAVFLLAV